MPTHRPETWSCNICGTWFDALAAAAACEAVGVPTALPLGLVHGGPGFYAGIVFMEMGDAKPQNHFRHDSKCAWRDNGAGDSVGSARCGGGFQPEQPPLLDPAVVDWPSFRRMLAWARVQAILPIAVVGGRLGSLSEWAAAHGVVLPGWQDDPDAFGHDDPREAP